MKKYDAILTVGNGFSKDWQLPSEMIPRMRYIADLFFKGVSDTIIISSKWSIHWDLQNITPPITEAEIMKKALINFGVPEKNIIKEERSKDTIGNAYYSKIFILEQKRFRKILIVCSDFHLSRVRFLFKKILGNSYDIEYKSFPTERSRNKKFMIMEQEILNGQKKFLEGMETGNDAFLNGKLYSDKYYQKKESQRAALAAMGFKMFFESGNKLILKGDYD